MHIQALQSIIHQQTHPLRPHGVGQLASATTGDRAARERAFVSEVLTHVRNVTLTEREVVTLLRPKLKNLPNFELRQGVGNGEVVLADIRGERLALRDAKILLNAAVRQRTVPALPARAALLPVATRPAVPLHATPGSSCLSVLPNWNMLPTAAAPATASILQYLKPDDLINLSNVSQAWRNAITPRAFDQAAQAFIADREGGGNSAWPLLANAGFSTIANELTKKGFRYAAALVNLQSAIDRFPSLNPDSAQTHEIAPLVLAGRGPFYTSSTSEPELLARHSGSAPRLCFVSQKGEVRAPSLLTGYLLPRSDLDVLAVVNSTLNRGNEQLLVVNADTDLLSVYRLSDDTLSHLPLNALINNDDCASISADGRFVAVIYRYSGFARLVVLDRQKGVPVSDELIDVDSGSVTVDSSGVALVAMPRTGAIIRPNQGGISFTPLSVQNSVFKLSHDERNIIRSGDEICDIVLEGRDGNGRIALKYPNAPSNVSVESIAFSRANAIAALTYSDASVAIFELVGNETGERLPSVHLQRSTPRPQSPSIASFGKDGTKLLMTFTEWDTEWEPPAEGATDGSFTATIISLPLVE